MARAYGYGYDGANRLLFGDYVAQNATGGWNAEQQRFALSGMRYEESIKKCGAFAVTELTATVGISPIGIRSARLPHTF